MTPARLFRESSILIYDLFLWLYWFPLRKILKAFPLRASYAFSSSIARLASHFFPGLRKDLSYDISKILPDRYNHRELSHVAKRSIEINLNRHLEDLFLGCVTKEFLNEIVAVEGKQFLDQSQQRGKGTIILLSHFGSFLMVLPALAFMGYPTNQLVGPPLLEGQRKIYQKIFQAREREYSALPVRFLRSDLHMKQVFKVLKNNECLAIAFDGREGYSWITVNFLSRKSYFSAGPVKLAHKTGATILPTFIVRQRDGSHKLIFEKPFVLMNTPDKKDFLLLNTQRLAQIFEKYIREYPTHFVMVIHSIAAKAKEGAITKPLLI